MRETYREDYDYSTARPNDLKPLDELGDWQIAEGDDVRGWDLQDQSGNSIGKIKDVLVDPKTGEAIFAIIEHGGLMGIGGKNKLVPLDDIRPDPGNKRAILDIPADRVDQSPDFARDTRDFTPFYDFWLQKRTAAAQPEHMETATGKMAGAHERVIPEVEEHLEVGKRAEQVGEVQIHKEVETRPETVHETVQRTRIRMFRRPVTPGREVAAGEQVLREGESITIPVVEEKLVTQKKAEVTGEVVVSPETVQEEKAVTEQVRKEHVKVEEHGEAELEEEEEEAHRTGTY